MICKAKKKRKIDRWKVEDREIKRQKGIGYEKTKNKEKKYASFREQITRKEENGGTEVCTVHVLGKHPQETQVKDGKTSQSFCRARRSITENYGPSLICISN